MGWDLSRFGVKETVDAAHRDLLREAFRFAWKQSPDQSTRIGSALAYADGSPLYVEPEEDDLFSYELIDENGAVPLCGANRFPKRIRDNDEELEILLDSRNKQLKYGAITHAERDSIFQAAERGIPTEGKTEYVTAYACLDCANAIASSGIERVVGYRPAMEALPERWRESVERGLWLLNKSGVEMLLYSGDLGGVNGLTDGRTLVF